MLVSDAEQRQREQLVGYRRFSFSHLMNPYAVVALLAVVFIVVLVVFVAFFFLYSSALLYSSFFLSLWLFAFNPPIA